MQLVMQALARWKRYVNSLMSRWGRFLDEPPENASYRSYFASKNEKLTRGGMTSDSSQSINRWTLKCYGNGEIPPCGAIDPFLFRYL